MVAVDSRKKWATLCVQIYVIAYFLALVALYANGNSQLAAVDAKDLVRRGDFVGYQNGSFVLKLLKELNFEDSNIKVYDSREEYHEALEKGSENGGVSAIFDEIPYIEAILEKNCGKYRRVGPIHQMKGFGFVFPRGSSYVPDFSRAVSSVVEGEKILQIEKKWNWRKRTCQDPLETKPSIFLSINTIRLLFCFIIPIFANGVLAATPVDVNVAPETTGRRSYAPNNVDIEEPLPPPPPTPPPPSRTPPPPPPPLPPPPPPQRYRKTWSEKLCPCMENSSEPADCANTGTGTDTDTDTDTYTDKPNATYM